MGIQERKLREFENRGQEILDAALSLFESDDWEQVTVEQIAQKSEVGKGTIYKHFESKSEIYVRLAIRFQKHIASEINLIDTSLPVLDRLRCYIKVAWEIHLSSKELHRVFMFCSRAEFRSQLPSQLLSDMQDAELQVGSYTYQLMTEGIDRGLFADKPIHLLIFGLQSIFWGSIQLIWSGYLGDIDHEEHLEEVTSFMIAGLVHHNLPIPTTNQNC